MSVRPKNGRFQRRMQRAKMFVPLIAALVFGSSACDALTEPVPPTFDSQPSSAVVGTPAGGANQVRRGTIAEQLSLRGRVVAVNEIPLFFKSDGWIKDLKISLGDQVEKGTLLAEMQSPSLERQLHDAQYSLDVARLVLETAKTTSPLDRVAQAQAAVDQAQVSLARAKLDLARLTAPPTPEEIGAARLAIEQAKNNLWAIQVDRDGIKGGRGPEYQGEVADARVAASENSVAAAQLNLEIKLKGAKPEEVAVAQNAVVAAEANLNAAITNLQYEQASKDLNTAAKALDLAKLEKEVSYRGQVLQMAEQQLGDTKLVASFTGTIISIDAKVGDNVKPFSPVGILADPSRLQVETNIPAEQVGGVAVGMAAKMTLDGVQDKTFLGKITSIADKATAWQGQSVYRATIAFDKGTEVPATMRIGSDITLAGQTKNNVLLLPAGAVTRDGDRRYVQLVVGGKARKVEVKVGATAADWVEIVSGLQDGDQVAVPAPGSVQTIAR